MQKEKELVDYHPSMRGYFAGELHKQMQNNPKIWVITADLGYGMFDKIRDDFPERYINTGAAEQTALGVSVGLALEGKIPFVYSITPFLLYRPFETIRNYVNELSIPVKLIGGGRDKDYAHDGFSHWAREDCHVMTILHNIKARWPDAKEEMPSVVEWAIANDQPTYINLKR